MYNLPGNSQRYQQTVILYIINEFFIVAIIIVPFTFININVTIIIIIIVIICRHRNAGYLQLYMRNKPRFQGVQTCRYSAVATYGTRNTVSNDKRCVLAQYHCFL